MITCHQAQQHIERQALGETLPPAASGALEAHLATCQRCYLRQVWEQRITDELQRETIPAPTADFESRVLAAATGRGQRRRVASPVVGGAIAAALALAVVTASLWTPDQQQPANLAGASGPEAATETGAPTVAEPAAAWSREQTVRLAFTSGSKLDNVSLTLELPPNVELARFPGHHELTWQVNLKPGDNVIALPLRIAYPEPGELVAHLDDGKNRKTFRAAIPGLERPEQEPGL